MLLFCRLLRYLSRFCSPVCTALTLVLRTPAPVTPAAAPALVLPGIAVVRSMFGGFASLGVLNALTGATQYASNPSGALNATVGVPATAVFALNGTPVPPNSWRVTGALPPGISVSGQSGPSPLNINAVSISLSGTPTMAGRYNITLQAWEYFGQVGLSAGLFSYTINVAAAPAGSAATTPVVIGTQPEGQSVTVGDSVSFRVIATAVPPPSFRWRKNDVEIAGATGATLTLSSVQSTDAGVYTVVVENDVGRVVSAEAILKVNPAPTLPVITLHPMSRTVNAGGTLTFVAEATGEPAPRLQWKRDGAELPGATTASLTLVEISEAHAGDYMLTATNAAGSVTSRTATLMITPLLVVSANPGRLINLSILSQITARDPSFSVGVVVGGSGTSGSKPLLLRAVGPALAAFGITGALNDPKLEVVADGSTVATNDNWDGTPALTALALQVGAFALGSTGSRDAALAFAPEIAETARSFSVTVSGVGGATGAVLAELYDATPTAALGSTTPRLINVSVLKQIDAGGSLSAGFVVAGATSRQVLIRAVGPTLGETPFHVRGVMTNPKIDLFDPTSRLVAGNDDWGGTVALATAFTTVGAFTLPPASRDAALLVTLAPGSYVATVSGVDGGGIALVEIYEMP